MFGEEEKKSLTLFMRILGLDKLHKAAILDLINKIEADAFFNVIVRRTEMGDICLTKTAVPELNIPELTVFRRIRELCEHELGVVHYDKYKRLVLLEFWHINRAWLLQTYPDLQDILREYVVERHGLSYPKLNLTYYNKALSGYQTKTSFSGFSEEFPD